jgi:hypothetical protein
VIWVCLWGAGSLTLTLGAPPLPNVPVFVVIATGGSASNKVTVNGIAMAGTTGETLSMLSDGTTW